MAYSEEIRTSNSSTNTAMAPVPEAREEGSLVPDEPEWKPTIHQTLIFYILAAISFMVSLDGCVIVTSLSAIATALDGDATQGFWVGTAYLLPTAACMPFIAATSDVFGRTICLVASLLMFTVGSIVCAASQNMPTLLAGRCIQGIGGGGIMVLCLVTFTDIVPLRYRPKYYGIVLAAWALGNVLGPVIGGAIAEKTTWRAVFYIMFPFCGLGLVGVPWLLTLKPKTATMGEKLARIDWFGGLLFIGSATSFLIAISWGGSQYSWNSVQTIAPLVVGAVGLAGTCVWEGYFAKEPFLRHRLFGNVSSVATYFCGAVQGLLLVGQLYYVPFFFFSVKGYSFLQTGLAILPVMVTTIPSSIITGGLVTRLNSYRPPIWVGWALTTLSTGLTVYWGFNDSAGVWVPVLVILGFGHGTILNAQNFATQAMCQPGDEGAAAAMYAFVRQFGMAIGVGIGGSTFQNAMSLKLGWLGMDTSPAHNAEIVAYGLRDIPWSPQKDGLIQGYKWGFVGVFAVYTSISGAAMLASLFIKHYDLNKKLETEHTLHESRAANLLVVTMEKAGSSRAISEKGQSEGTSNAPSVAEVSVEASAT